MREYNNLSSEYISVIVPTVDRMLPLTGFWLMTADGDRLCIESVSGCPYWGSRFRIKALNISFSCRWDSAATVSNTMDDFPAPETPVNTVSYCLGILRSIFFKLFSR